MESSARTLRAYIQRLFFTAFWLTDFHLTPRERRSLGGLLFTEDFAFVDGVADAMTGAADLFRDAPVQGPALRAAQDEALDWKFARDAFSLLGRFCNDMYLFKQASTTTQALLIVREAQETAALQPPDSEATQRLHALHTPIRILGRRYQRYLHSLRRGAAQPAAANEPTPPRRKPQKQRASLIDMIDLILRRATAQK